MIKGIQKQMVMVRTSDSSLFETAYFVLRDGIERERSDIVTEANRLVSEVIAERGRGKVRSRKRRRWLPFLLGLICGAAATVLTLFLIRLF